MQQRWMRVCCLLDWEFRTLLYLPRDEYYKARKALLESNPRARLLYRLKEALEARF